MESYTGFAQVYDLFMEEVPYDLWADYLEELLKEENISDALVLDLGCGTGSMTERMAAKGYDMIGVDLSGEMLQIAMENSVQTGSNILYLMQDMREFELYGTVAAVFSVCDCINYILEYEDLVQVFRLVNNYLDPNGIFIFDMNTEYKYSRILGSSVIAENREEASFIWENEYDPESRINEYALTLFIQNEDGLFEKTEEIHLQKAWRIEEIKAALKEAGMKFEAVYETATKQAPGKRCERVTVIAREQGKEPA